MPNIQLEIQIEYDKAKDSLINLSEFISDLDDSKNIAIIKLQYQSKDSLRLFAAFNVRKEKEQKLENQRLHLLEDVEEVKRDIITKTELEINNIFETLKNPNLKMHEVINAKRRLKELDDNDIEINERYKEEISVGDYVSLSELNITGRVERISGNRVFIVSTDGIKFTSSKERVQLSEEPANKEVAKAVSIPTITGDVKLELNVIGLHVDEALAEVEKYLDSVRLRRFSQVRIIHGFGTGALKRAIHEYLKKCDFIAEFRLGDQHEGGGGATVVKLK